MRIPPPPRQKRRVNERLRDTLDYDVLRYLKVIGCLIQLVDFIFYYTYFIDLHCMNMIIDLATKKYLVTKECVNQV